MNPVKLIVTILVVIASLVFATWPLWARAECPEFRAKLAASCPIAIEDYDGLGELGTRLCTAIEQATDLLEACPTSCREQSTLGYALLNAGCEVIKDGAPSEVDPKTVQQLYAICEGWASTLKSEIQSLCEPTETNGIINL